eukprot:scaffold27123_cov18-Tisochrysis_lutea.AAC.1
MPELRMAAEWNKDVEIHGSTRDGLHSGDIFHGLTQQHVLAKGQAGRLLFCLFFDATPSPCRVSTKHKA